MVENGRWTVDVPEKEGIKGLVQTFLNHYREMGKIANTPGIEPINFYYSTIFVISLISEIEVRDEILRLMEEKKKQLTEEYKKENDIEKLTEKQKNHILIVSSLLSITYIQKMYIDKFIGLNDNNKVGFVVGNNIEPTEEEIEEDLLSTEIDVDSLTEEEKGDTTNENS